MNGRKPLEHQEYEIMKDLWSLYRDLYAGYRDNRGAEFFDAVIKRFSLVLDQYDSELADELAMAFVHDIDRRAKEEGYA